MKREWLPKNFKCPQCHKIYPTTQCSNQIWKGKWVCKMCNKLFEGNVLGYIDEDEQQAVLTAEEILCEENRFE